MPRHTCGAALAAQPIVRRRRAPAVGDSPVTRYAHALARRGSEQAQLPRSCPMKRGELQDRRRRSQHASVWLVREQSPGRTGANSDSGCEQFNYNSGAAAARGRPVLQREFGLGRIARPAGPHRVLMVPSWHVLRSRGHGGESWAVKPCRCGGAFGSNARARHSHRWPEWCFRT